MAAITVQEIARLVADSPVFQAYNQLQDYSAEPKWTLTGTWAGADVTAPGFAATRAHDGRSNRPTKPVLQDSPAVDEYFLNFNLGGFSNVLDAAGVFGHNFHELAGTVTVQLQYDISGVGTYTVPNTVTLATWTPTGTDQPKRLISWDFLGTYERLTTISHVRLRIASTTDFIVAPYLNELTMGRRRQMAWPGDRPFTDLGIGNVGGSFRTSGGNTSDHTDEERGAAFPRVWEAKDFADETGLNDYETLQAFFRDCKGGRFPFMYCERPGSLPNHTHFMRLPQGSRLEAVYSTPASVGIALSFIEESPFLDPELD